MEKSHKDEYVYRRVCVRVGTVGNDQADRGGVCEGKHWCDVVVAAVLPMDVQVALKHAQHRRHTLPM